MSWTFGGQKATILCGCVLNDVKGIVSVYCYIVALPAWLCHRWKPPLLVASRYCFSTCVSLALKFKDSFAFSCKTQNLLHFYRWITPQAYTVLLSYLGPRSSQFLNLPYFWKTFYKQLNCLIRPLLFFVHTVLCW